MVVRNAVGEPKPKPTFKAGNEVSFHRVVVRARQHRLAESDREMVRKSSVVEKPRNQPASLVRRGIVKEFLGFAGGRYLSGDVKINASEEFFVACARSRLDLMFLPRRSEMFVNGRRQLGGRQPIDRRLGFIRWSGRNFLWRGQRSRLDSGRLRRCVIGDGLDVEDSDLGLAPGQPSAYECEPKR